MDSRFSAVASIVGKFARANDSTTDREDNLTMEVSNSSLMTTSDPTDWAMLAAYNLSMDDLLVSFGLGSNSRWFGPQTEFFLIFGFCVAILLGLVGNLLVAFMLCRRGNFRLPRHWYLFNLMVSDILTCVLCMPFTLLRLTLKDWRLGEVLCRIAPFLQLTYVFVSVFTILGIAVERYRAIVCSNRLNPHRQRIARLVIPAIWLLSMGLAAPLAVTHRLDHVRNTTGEVMLTLCVEHWDNDTLLGVYTVLVLLCQYAVPAVAIMTFHLLICRFLRSRVHLRVDSKKSQQNMARHRKNLILLTIISITFAVEWLPITVVNIIADFDYTIFPSADTFSLTFALCLLFALTSVFINPVVYGCFNSNFRRDLLQLCSKSSSTDLPDSTYRRGSSEVVSRLYTTVVGSSGVSKPHSSQDSGAVDASLYCNHLKPAASDSETNFAAPPLYR